MKKRLLLLLLTSHLALSGCGILPEVQDETKKWSAHQLYVNAKDELEGGNYTKAIQYFELLEARYPYGRYAQQAQLEVAYAYFKDKEITSALAACDRFIKLHPSHPYVDYAYYLKGLINFNEDLGLLGGLSDQDLSERDPRAAKEAFESFKELASRFPKSKYTPDAIQRMTYLVNALANYEVHVARYYFSRKAYVAAVNRAQYAIQTYPQAPARQEAFQILAKAYDALGMSQLRDDTLRLAKTNSIDHHVDTTYDPISAKKQEVEAPWWRFWNNKNKTSE